MTYKLLRIKGTVCQKKILLVILNELITQSAANGEIWNADNIAQYMRLSISSIQSRIICRRDFPRAVRIPTTDLGGGRRWYAAEIKNWLRNNRVPLRK